MSELQKRLDELERAIELTAKGVEEHGTLAIVGFDNVRRCLNDVRWWVVHVECAAPQGAVPRAVKGGVVYSREGGEE